MTYILIINNTNLDENEKHIHQKMEKRLLDPPLLSHPYSIDNMELP